MTNSDSIGKLLPSKFWFTISFFTLGFLVGNLVGLNAESKVESLIAALFAIGGGTFLTAFPKLETSAINNTLKAIFFISIGCLAGIYSGILTSEYQLLSPVKDKIEDTERKTIEDKKYLRSDSIFNMIDNQYRHHEITPEEAYEKLFKQLKDENK